MKKAAEEAKGEPLTLAEKQEIHNKGMTIEVPKSVHEAGDTYFRKNTKAQIAADAADLAAAAARDYATQTKNLVEAGYDPQDVAAAMDKLRAANKERGIG